MKHTEIPTLELQTVGHLERRMKNYYLFIDHCLVLNVKLKLYKKKQPHKHTHTHDTD